MNIRIWLVFVIAASGVFAETPVTVRWVETPQLFAGRTAVAWLNSGKKMEGEWLSVTPDSFTMLVRDRRVTLQRADLRDLGFRHRRIRGRVWGTIGGSYLGLAFAYAGAGEAAAGTAVLAGGVLGHFAGRAFDRSIVHVTIQKDPPPNIPDPAAL